MTFWERKEQAQRLRGLPLERVLALCGAQADRHDRHKWHTPSGVLSVSGTRFLNWSLGGGGGGAIDLVMHLRSLDFQGAVDWLAQHGEPALPAEPATAPTRVALRLPTPQRKWLGRVRDYLLVQRGLPRELLEPLIEAGSLYADDRANAVFLLRDRQHCPVGAELRGTSGSCWRGLAPGSRKDSGCFSIGVGSRGVILCESAIDAISCWALHPEHGCVSTAGARPNPRWLGHLLGLGRPIACGFDNDVAGEQRARALIALHPAVKRLRPSAHDWNDQLRAGATPGADQPQEAEAFTTWKEARPETGLAFEGTSPCIES